MSTPSLAGRADTPRPTDTTGAPDVLVISVRADEQGARAAARWAEQVVGAGASVAVSSDTTLEQRVDAARRVLVLDPGVIAARRGFGVRGTARERLALVARLAGRTERVTWAATGAQATQWVRAGV